MPTIYLVDYLGVHCGMHYYLEAFRRVLSNIEGFDVKYISNHSESQDSKPILLNQYNGNILQKGISLIKNLRRLKKFIKKHPDDYYIYLTYGNSIDVHFMKIISGTKHHLIDIHEAIAQNVDSNQKLKDKFHKLYSSDVKGVISHSPRTDDFLKEYGFEGKYFTVPHFKYILPKEYDDSLIPDEVRNAPAEDKINLLFFGNLNESKGVDILIDAINRIDANVAQRINVVIAGKDFDGAIDRVIPKEDRNVKIIRRRISDDELKYLYSKTDYITLPYRKTSQSGILEMAFYFKKPIIASDVTYFRKTLGEFPSFGVLAGKGADDYARAIENVITEHSNRQYFLDHDFARYENRAEVELFCKELEKWLKN